MKKRFRLIPKVGFTNYHKEFPQTIGVYWKDWLYFQRNWGGALWNLRVRHFEIEIDFRRCWITDMIKGI